MFMLKLMIKCNFIKIDAHISNSCFNLLLEKAIRHFFLNLFLPSKEFLITLGWDTPSSTIAVFSSSRVLHWKIVFQRLCW